MDSITLQVQKQGQSYEIEVRLVSYAYTYRFVLQLEQIEIYFEPDEERNLRAIVPPDTQLSQHQKELLSLIGDQLQAILN
jgi:hypothetical protein